MTTATEEKLVRQKITHSFLLSIFMLSGLFDRNVDTFAAMKTLPIRWEYFRCEAGTFTLKKKGTPCREVACEKGRVERLCARGTDLLRLGRFGSRPMFIYYSYSPSHYFCDDQFNPNKFLCSCWYKAFQLFLTCFWWGSVHLSVYPCVCIIIMMIIGKKKCRPKMSRVEQLSTRAKPAV